MAWRTLVLGPTTLFLLAALAACAPSGPSHATGDSRIDIVGFAVPEAANAAIANAFEQTPTGKDAILSGSYGASGDQSRKVVAGASADYVHFSLDADITRLVDAGLLNEDWNTGAHRGIVSTSVVALIVPEGNPKKITGWDDLVRDDVRVITPDPDSSGSARWNILALWGHASADGQSTAQASTFLSRVFANVTQWAGSGREGIEGLDSGSGDVLISYENEAILARQKGKRFDYIVPDTTLLIENPGAVLVRAGPLAHAWLAFILSEKGQTIFAQTGFRPLLGTVTPTVRGANNPKDPYPAPKNLLTIDEDFGGWPAATASFFDKGGLIDEARTSAIRP